MPFESIIFTKYISDWCFSVQLLWPKWGMILKHRYIYITIWTIKTSSWHQNKKILENNKYIDMNEGVLNWYAISFLVCSRPMYVCRGVWSQTKSCQYRFIHYCRCYSAFDSHIWYIYLVYRYLQKFGIPKTEMYFS